MRSRFSKKYVIFRISLNWYFVVFLSIYLVDASSFYVYVYIYNKNINMYVFRTYRCVS